MAKGYGDRLARGGIKAVFPATEGGVSNKRWEDAFKDFDPEKFRNSDDKKEVGVKLGPVVRRGI